jgi:hypothetical protein
VNVTLQLGRKQFAPLVAIAWVAITTTAIAAQVGTPSILLGPHTIRVKKKLNVGCEDLVMRQKEYTHPDGCIVGADKSAGPLLVRLSRVDSIEIHRVKVNTLGHFSLAKIPIGEYVLIATQSGKVLCLKTIDVPLKASPIVVDVEPGIEVPIYEF